MSAQHWSIEHTRRQTMEVGSAIELYTTLLGWILYDKLWDALAETGVAYIPFLALIVRNFALSWEKYGMEGAAASMRGMEIPQ